MLAFAPILAAVQANCHLSDARHAQELSLCNYLLSMREYYRWEHDLPLDAVPPRAEVARWIAEREELWESLAGADWSPLPLASGGADPFDVDAVNAELVPAGLLYGAGRGRFGKPHFFLARLAGRASRDGVAILEAGCEYARDLDAAPAVLQGETIVLRREAFQRWLWLTAEAWDSRAAEGSMAVALEAYGYGKERAAALARMAEAAERGFLGVATVLGLYGAFFASAATIAARARDRAGVLLVVALSSTIAFHVLYNSAMVIGLVPITGIPLPFLSYGGSFTLINWIAVGVLLGVE